MGNAFKDTVIRPFRPHYSSITDSHVPFPEMSKQKPSAGFPFIKHGLLQIDFSSQAGVSVLPHLLAKKRFP